MTMLDAARLEQLPAGTVPSPLYAGSEGFYAHMALRDQLIALEALSDDL